MLAPLLFGIGLGDLLAGLPIDAQGDFTGSFLDLLTPYGLFYGVTLLVLCLLHGVDLPVDPQHRGGPGTAQGIARRLAIPAAVLVVGYRDLDLRAGPAGHLAAPSRWPSRWSR